MYVLSTSYAVEENNRKWTVIDMKVVSYANTPEKTTMDKKSSYLPRRFLGQRRNNFQRDWKLKNATERQQSVSSLPIDRMKGQKCFSKEQELWVI